MALRTNSEKAIENIKKYVVDHYRPWDYENAPETNDFNTIAAVILDTFKAEYLNDYNRRGNRQELFADWASGLPGILDTCYYYNRHAVDDLGAILEESETEKAKYSESDAERLLTYLIYREITKAA